MCFLDIQLRRTIKFLYWSNLRGVQSLLDHLCLVFIVSDTHEAEQTHCFHVSGRRRIASAHHKASLYLFEQVMFLGATSL